MISHKSLSLSMHIFIAPPHPFLSNAHTITFDQALFILYEDGAISYEEAMRNADSKNELRLRIKLESKRESSIADQQSESLHIMEEDTAKTY